MSAQNRLTSETLGLRTTRAAAALPQTASAAIFTVTDRVLITAIVGEVTVAIQSGANSAKLFIDPTAAGLANTDLCVAVDIASLAIGSLVSLTGDVADDLQLGAVAVAFDRPLMVPAGSIKLDCTASKTGQIAWTIHYVPYDDTARIRAA